MRNNVFIFHGIQGNPGENWFPWLKKELEKNNCNVIIPALPHPNQPELSEWLRELDRYKDALTPDTLFIGHSLGASFLLSVLEKYPAKGAFFVSSVFGDFENEFKERMRNFTDKNFDWIAIQRNCKNFFVFHGDDDPYLPLSSTGKKLAAQLGVSFITIKNGGHLNMKAGFTKFPLLLKMIEGVL